MPNSLVILNSNIVASVAEHTANKRRLALQLLDHDARRLVQRALHESLDAIEAKLRRLRQQRALDRVRGRVWADGGAYLVQELAARYASTLRLLEAID